MHHHS